jgi:hypothetical protein
MRTYFFTEKELKDILTESTKEVLMEQALRNNSILEDTDKTFRIDDRVFCVKESE